MNQTKLRALRHVRRFNFEPCVRYQSVAEHSFFVAALVLDLAGIAEMSLGDQLAALRLALIHDATEAATGDIPYLVRKSMDKAALADLEWKAALELEIDPSACSDVIDVVSYADALELAVYLREERLMGNSSLIEIERETRGRLQEHLPDGRPTPFFAFALSLLGGPEEWNEVGIKEMHDGLKH